MTGAIATTCMRRHSESNAEGAPIVDCACCRAGKSCVGVLRLDARQEAQLMRVLTIVGTADIYRPMSATISAPRIARIDVEPTSRVFCPTCGAGYELATFLADFVRDHRASAPRCSDCRNPQRVLQVAQDALTAGLAERAQ